MKRAHGRLKLDTFLIKNRFCTFVIAVEYCMSDTITNPLSPHDALKHHFTSLKKYLIFLQPGVLERKFP